MSGACALSLDQDNTSITFAASWWGVITVRGTFDRIAGELIVPNGDLASASLSLDVEAASIRSGVRLRDQHLRGPRFLDAARFPNVHFSSSRVERVNGAIEVTGRLTLRGTERAIVARCPLGAEGPEIDTVVAMATVIHVPRLPHDVGSAAGIHRLNPLLHAIGTHVTVSVTLLVPAARLLPALPPALRG